jgi:single-strand DNA-binding protein
LINIKSFVFLHCIKTTQKMSINKVILVGNVGKAPEVHYIDEGLAVARFPLATSERGYQTRDGRQVPDRTEWHNIVVWRRLAEVAEKYVRKGTQLYLEGKIRTNSFEDKDGIKRYRTEIIVDVLQLLGSRENNPAAQGSGTTGTAQTGSTSQPGQQQAPGTTASENTTQNETSKTDDTSPDDDLPF